MSDIKCGSCGGELKKEGNVFICQKCGEVFKNEETAAKGNAPVRTGSAKIKQNFSEEELKRINNLYTVARRAKENGDNEQAEKYYDMVLAEDPNSWEAAYFTTYFNVAQTKIGNISSAALKLSNCLDNVFNLIDKYEDSENEGKAISTVFVNTRHLASLLSSSAKNHYLRFKNTGNSGTEYAERCINIHILLYKLGNLIEEHYIDIPVAKNMCVTAWEEAVEVGKASPYYTDSLKQSLISCSEKIKKYNPDYQVVTFNKGGCYVATCVYGSYDCPEVWTLRRYRDQALSQTWYGRAFIHAYYFISPKLVRLFGDTNWFKGLWKGKLDKLVKVLNDKGYKNTKYIDKY